MKPEEFYHQFHVWLVENGQNYIFGVIVFIIGYLCIRFVKMRLRSRMGLLKGVGRVNGRSVIDGTMTFALGDLPKNA